MQGQLASRFENLFTRVAISMIPGLKFPGTRAKIVMLSIRLACFVAGLHGLCMPIGRALAR